jgi:hypothetical protein
MAVEPKEIDIFADPYEKKTEFTRLSKPSLSADLNFKIGSNPLPIQTLEQDQVSATREQAQATRDLSERIETLEQASTASYRKEQLMAAGAKFGIDMLNIANQYQNISGVARFNIMQARNQASDALFRGRQAGFERQSEGIRAGKQALLAMAAQGQSVDSESVQKIQRSYEAVGMVLERH